MICIPLTKGQHALIDNDDWELVSSLAWCVNEYRAGVFRAVARTSRKQGHKCVYLHRLILGVSDKNVHVDHIDGNPLNNCRSNLRKTVNQLNRYNSKRYSTNSSGFKGVSYSKVAQKWHAYINHNSKRINLGFFETPQAAYAAYCSAASELHGEYARLE